MHMYFLKGALATSAPAPSVLFGIQNLLFHINIHSKQSRAHPTSNGAIGPEKEVPSEREPRCGHCADSQNIRRDTLSGTEIFCISVIPGLYESALTRSLRPRKRNDIDVGVAIAA